MANETAQLKPTIGNVDGANHQAGRKDIQMTLIKRGVWDYQLDLAEIHLACETEERAPSSGW